MNGKYYNRCWLIHETFAQSIEKSFTEEYITILNKFKKFDNALKMGNKRIHR